MAKEVAKWKQEILDRLRKMTNAELLNFAFEATFPDDYDGGFTARAAWEADVSRLELYERLWTQGFIGEEDVKGVREFVGQVI